MEIILLIILLIVTVGVLYLQFTNRTSFSSQDFSDVTEKSVAKIEGALRDEISTNRKESATVNKEGREEIAKSIKDFGDSVNKQIVVLAETQNKNFEGFSIKLTELIDKNDTKMDKVREIVEKKLESIQKDNGEKLEAMRVTVDEKLHATLEKRFGESFKLVSDRLDLVHKGLGEMQVLASGVGDLKKVLNNVKTRGTWGEAQLGNLIEEIFTPDQYEKNVRTKKTSKDNVEYAIKLPGNEDGKHIWLPIDAKFPLEDYQKLIEAQDRGDMILIEEFGKLLENRIKSEAKDIRDKYIDVPNTTDFGILFVPTESLYAEILRRPGLYELLRKNYKVIITGPTTIQVILNSLQVGFRTLNIQKRSGEVWTVLSTIKTEFGKFGDLLEKTHKKIQEAGNIIEDAVTKTRTIEKKLNKVQDLPVAEVEEKLVLEIPDEKAV